MIRMFMIFIKERGGSHEYRITDFKFNTGNKNTVSG